MVERKQGSKLVKDGKEDYEVIYEGHMGGCAMNGDGATYYPHMWRKMIEKYNIESVVDVGCGRGFALDFFKDEGTRIHGVEGCAEAVKKNLAPADTLKLHDYENDGCYIPLDKYDLCWSCEFVEHVEEQKKNNFIATFRRAKLVAMTYATPGQGGHHHVNEKPEGYWVSTMASEGFSLLSDDTNEMRVHAYGDHVKYSPFYESHFIKRGLIFKNDRYEEEA